MRFQDKTVIITGAGSGIGRACAQRLSSEGASVVLIDRDLSALEETAEGCANASGILLRPHDVSVETDCRETYEAALETFGYVDGFVNIAGAMIYQALGDLKGEDWSRIMTTNFFAATYFTTQAFNHMTRGGALVYVSSIHAHQTSSLVGPYAAAKAALTSLARTASIEGRARNIRANSVLPGAVDTPMLRESPNIKSGLEVLNPLDIGRPEDIAATIAFALSDEARFLTGSEIIVDGGRLAKL